MSKVTQGPWRYVYDYESGYTPHVEYGGGYPIEGIKQNGLVTQGTVVHKAPDETERSIANAHLIAAAPELLEACKIAVEYCEAFGIEKSEYVWEPLLMAIAKAEGNKK